MVKHVLQGPEQVSIGGKAMLQVTRTNLIRGRSLFLMFTTNETNTMFVGRKNTYDFVGLSHISITRQPRKLQIMWKKP